MHIYAYSALKAIPKWAFHKDVDGEDANFTAHEHCNAGFPPCMQRKPCLQPSTSRRMLQGYPTASLRTTPKNSVHGMKCCSNTSTEHPSVHFNALFWMPGHSKSSCVPRLGLILGSWGVYCLFLHILLNTCPALCARKSHSSHQRMQKKKKIALTAASVDMLLFFITKH